jgi:hypothetical protein
MHDWARVPAGIFHALHHGWMSVLSDVLNTSLLPKDYYALLEGQAAGFSPDACSVRDAGVAEGQQAERGAASATVLHAPPRTRFVAETTAEFYRRKKSWIAVRHVSGDRIVAMLEVVSPGNKSNCHAFRAFVDKACELLERRIHLLIVDPLPPTSRDPQGVHAAIWAEVEDAAFELPADKPLTLVAYECDLSTRAYVEPVAVGDALPDMPQFLEPNGCVMVPLETTYQSSFAVMPRRWKNVLEAAPEA